MADSTRNGAAAGDTRPKGPGTGPFRTAPVAAPTRDPLGSISSIGPRIPVAVTIAIAISLHAGVAAGATAAALLSEMYKWNKVVRESIAANLAQTYDVDLVKEPEAPPPPPEPEPPPPEDKPEPPPVKEPEPQENTPPPPPAAAEAAKVLTQEPDKEEPIDMTGNTFVTGNGTTYAGGVTQAGGTSKTAVYNPHAVATGVPGGTGTAPAPPAPRVDRSRGAGLLGSTDWGDCPFPAEADAEQIDDAYVTIQVRTRPDGAADAVTIVQDPGHGFGREARRCAMRKRYEPALDVNGSPIPGTTRPIRVHFQR